MNPRRRALDRPVPKTDELQIVAERLHEIVGEELAALRREVAALSIQARRNDIILVVRAGTATVLFWAGVGVLIGAGVVALLLRVL